MTIKTSLCAVPYEVTEQDGQVIFEERSGFAGTHCRFTLEWRGCGWYLVDFDDWAGRVFAPHIAAALEWVEANYVKEWHDGTATMKLNTSPSRQHAKEHGRHPLRLLAASVKGPISTNHA